ncbi:MAG: hypothetical protein V8T87_08430, partial [Victivallales bacterium]
IGMDLSTERADYRNRRISAGNVVGIFRDAPLYALIGDIHTQGKVNGQGANASTKLNNITIGECFKSRNRGDFAE